LRRFAPDEVYGLAFTVGLLFTGLFSWAFGGIVEDLLSRDPLVDVDLAVLRFVYSHGDPDLTTGVVVFEAVFSPEVLLLAGAAVGTLLLLLGWRRREPQKLCSGVVLLAAASGTGILIELFKFLFDRPRPPSSLQLVPETGLGFPSGHAMAALVIGVVAVYVLSLRSPECWGGSWKAKVRIGLVVFALAFLVGIGRVYMGAHYPSDVLAGWALGGIWASLCLTAAEVLRKAAEDQSAGQAE
jgi:membrane-associated phospholipid phosphatase